MHIDFDKNVATSSYVIISEIVNEIKEKDVECSSCLESKKHFELK